eukprot:scaffold8827_cov270-Alexandrium_tamarense.AAC.2
MIYEAVGRNTDLLLVRGVGYASGGWEEEEEGEDGDDSRERKESVKCAVETYLEMELGISVTSVAKLKKHHPTLFQLSLTNKVKPVVNFMSSLLGYDVSSSTFTMQPKQKKQVSKLITNHPMLFQLDVASNLEPTARFLQTCCDLSNKELSTVIASTPGALGLSVENNLKPTIQFLTNVLREGVPTKPGGDSNGEDATIAKLRKCILKHPQILALSLLNLRAKMDYFDEIDELSHAGDENEEDDDKEHDNKGSLAARILVSAPSAYSLSLKDNIVPKIEFLGKHLWRCPVPASPWAEDNDESIDSCDVTTGCSLSERLREYPQILTLSLDGNIRPTLSFYNMTGYIEIDGHGLPQKPVSHHQPFIRSRYIATSLYNRLLPRWHYLLEEQDRKQQLLNSDESGTATPKYIITPAGEDSTHLPPLHLLAGAGDEVFCRQMKLSLTDYLAFKEEATPRLKFNTQFDMWLKTGRPIDLVASRD